MISNNYARPKVGIIDFFKKGIEPEAEIDINDDGIPDLCHGHLVEGVYLSSGDHNDLPKVQRFYQTYSTDILEKNVDKIIELNKSEKKQINWVNFSLIIDEKFNKGLLKNVTPENINCSENKKIVLSKENLEYRFLREIKLLEKLKKSVLKLYVIAGNNGSNGFNIYSLATGAKTIGGLNSKQKPHYESGNNSLIQRDGWAPYEFEGKLITKHNKAIGYDIAPKGQSGDGIPDICFDDESIKISGTNQPDAKIFIKGTSFSAPYKLGKDIIKELSL